MSLDQHTRLATTAHALAQIKARGITILDIQTALQSGTIISAERRDKGAPLWRVQGKTPDGAAIEIVVALDALNKTLKIVAAHYANVLEEVTGSELTPKLIERRVTDWASRIDALYKDIETWLPIGWAAEHSQTNRMHEELMRKFGIPARNLPILTLVHGKEIAARIEPRGLWIIGANGRLDFVRGRHHYVIVDTAESFARPNWHIAPLVSRDKLRPLNRKNFVDLL
jgi:hypothetical protein